MPTHREYPWERDRRAIEDRERHERRANASVPRRARPSRQGFELSLGGQLKANTHTRRRRRLKWPQLVMSAAEARLIRFCARAFTLAIVAYALLHRSVFVIW